MGVGVTARCGLTSGVAVGVGVEVGIGVGLGRILVGEAGVAVGVGVGLEGRSGVGEAEGVGVGDVLCATILRGEMTNPPMAASTKQTASIPKNRPGIRYPTDRMVDVMPGHKRRLAAGDLRCFCANGTIDA